MRARQLSKNSRFRVPDWLIERWLPRREDVGKFYSAQESSFDLLKYTISDKPSMIWERNFVSQCLVSMLGKQFAQPCLRLNLAAVVMRHVILQFRYVSLYKHWSGVSASSVVRLLQLVAVSQFAREPSKIMSGRPTPNPPPDPPTPSPPGPSSPKDGSCILSFF